MIEAAKGRPVILVNPRMSFMPLELSDFDTAYLLKQFSVVPVKTDMQVPMAIESPLGSGRSRGTGLRDSEEVQYPGGMYPKAPKHIG